MIITPQEALTNLHNCCEQTLTNGATRDILRTSTQVLQTLINDANKPAARKDVKTNMPQEK